MADDRLQIAGKTYNSRLLVGTGRYSSPDVMKAAVVASGAEIITVALRRVSPAFIAGSGVNQNQTPPFGGDMHELLPPTKYTYLPNSAGCYTAEEAVRTLRLARELGDWNLVKLEVIGDKNTLYPDMSGTLEAAKMLVKDGFDVMCYAMDDLDHCKALEQAGCVAVMPLASPIGSGQGIIHPERIAAIVNALSVPVLVDAGVGTASDATIAMELGCAGVLLNTAISAAKHPVMMAEAMKNAVISGRQAFLAGRMEKRGQAEASSPLAGKITPS